MKEFDFMKLYTEAVNQGREKDEIAEAMRVTVSALNRKLDGTRKTITVNQAVGLCGLVQKPMDNFVRKVK